MNGRSCQQILGRLLGCLMMSAALPAHANVFGDGDPGNGVEDDRHGLDTRQSPGSALDSWRDSSGTIHCDGEMRGSAMILDVSEFSRQAPGLFLATAAHVLVDLDAGKNFSACEFHFLSLSHLPDHRVRIDEEWVKSGPFDASMNVQSVEFGRHDWAFIHLPEGDQVIQRAGRIRPRVYSSAQPADAGRAPEYLLVAYDGSRRQMMVSGACSVHASRHDDLGGGRWVGQLLDSCDSGDGASGGGLVRSDDSGQYLVGIRSGSHWNPDLYPLDTYPAGPPPGALWDVRGNTNFARALDAALLSELRGLVDRAQSVDRVLGSEPGVTGGNLTKK